jgi:hypothetical protein
LISQRRQAPAPSHVPSQPHVAGGVDGQKVGVLGAAPAGLYTQMPGASPRLHVAHSPVHALSQQTPSAQKPLAQSPADAHGEPVGPVGRMLPRSKPPSARAPPAPPAPPLPSEAAPPALPPRAPAAPSIVPWSGGSSARDRQALATVPIERAASTHARIVPET